MVSGWEVSLEGLMGSRRISRRWFLLTALLVALALVAGIVWSARPKTNAITIEVTGTSGLPFQGTAEVDGTHQELNGTVPAEFSLEGRRVTYSFTSTKKSGGFQVRVLLGDLAIASAGSGNPPIRGIRGWVQSDWGWDYPRRSFENFSRDDDKGWLAPPPWDDKVTR
jgi:hypothetical protein